MINERFIELIDRYLLGTATDGEQRLVNEYLSKLEADQNALLTDEQQNKIKEVMWLQIQSQCSDKQNAKVVQIAWYRRKLFRTIAVAASVIIAVGALFFFKSSQPDKQTAVIKTAALTDSNLSVLHHEINITGKDKKILLPDGSMIVLADKSEISYSTPFTNARQISLEGKAYFKVVRDTVKPFTVTSGEISTVDLGTEFTVTSYKNTHQILVRLVEGKVMIRAAKKGIGNLKKDVYLLPGQEFIYSSNNPYRVRWFKVANGNQGESNKDVSKDNLAMPQNFKGSWYMFNNQSLQQVFDQLADLYKVKIVYDNKDIQHIYFTGKYSQSGPLENILNDIATIHHLTIAKKDNMFLISR
ncbi:MAG: FecR family protein [Ferruginibacter sp.]